MKLSELIRNECIRVGSQADDKAFALCEIAALAKESHLLKKIAEEDILEALQERETTGTTAFGHGIAIPHCRMKGVRDFVVGLMTVPGGVEFDSEDGNKVQFIVFIIAPQEDNRTHLRVLSAISQSLQDPAAVEKMIFAEDQKLLKQLFLDAARQEVSDQIPLLRDQIQIYVQDKGIYQEIAKAMTGLENVSMIVTPIQCPLSSTCEEGSDIVLIAERSLRNEVIRRVESVTGNLSECSGVLVSIQELALALGSLES